jgi:hypothetical protein
MNAWKNRQNRVQQRFERRAEAKKPKDLDDTRVRGVDWR